MKKILKTTILVFLGLKMLSCCDCNLEETINDTVPKNSITGVGKRQLIDDDDAEILAESETTEGTSTTEDESATGEKESNASNKTEPINEDEMRKICRHYKNAPVSNLTKLVDVWQIVYYKSEEKVQCFRVYIRNINAENKEELRKKYGSFNNVVDWNLCQFEIISNPNAMNDPKHYLQELQDAKDANVFDNILVMRHSDDDPPFLMEQSPNQWALLKNLLLMRDCENGDVVAFTRVPFQPSTKELEDALFEFGEPLNGTMACQEEKKEIKYKYKTIS